jgi:hypothetical protein
MRSLLAFSASILLLTCPCLAQRRAGVTPVGVGGFGNVLYPGTGGPSSFATRLGATVTGFPVSKRSIGFLNSYPLYVGGAYVPAYSSSAYAPDYSSQTQFAPQQQYSSNPPVIINQYFAPPLPPPPPPEFYQPSAERQQQYAEEDSAPAPNKYYLLAFKDHSVYSALAYWVEDKTLHYVTTQNTHNQASLDLVDLDFTKQLNRDRDVPFSLTTPSK